MSIALLLTKWRDLNLKPRSLMGENRVICCPDLPFKGRPSTSVVGSATTNTLKLSVPPSGIGSTSESYLVQHHISSQGGPHL